LFVIASPAEKIPATAVISAYANLNEILDFPLVRQMLAGKDLGNGIKPEDFRGKAAMGFTLGAKDPQKNFRMDVILQTEKPVAAKLFNALTAQALTEGAKKTKVGGKPAVINKNVRAILVSGKEIILQAKDGKLKFVNLKKSKNALVSAPECADNSVVAVMDIAKITKAFAKDIPAEAQALINEQNVIAVLAAKLNADGSIALTIRASHKDAASAQQSLQTYNTQMAELQNNPMLAAIAGKFAAKAQGNDMIISGKFTAEEIQMLIGQVMMMAASQAANKAPAAAPAAPAAK
jgi:hypothetical protein